MRLMWTSPALWNYPANDSSFRSLSRTKEFEIAEIGVEEGIDLDLESKILYSPMWCYGGTILSFNVAKVDNTFSRKTKCC
jgi:hypothetical protein